MFAPGTVPQVSCGILVTQIAVILQALGKPFDSPGVNKAALSAEFNTFLILYLGMVNNLDESLSSSQQQVSPLFFRRR
jgi:hypothetical protein